MPEIEIQALLDTIKSEGIDRAKAEEEKIIAQAKADAEKIIQDAKDEASKILDNAKAEIEAFKNQSITIIKQAESNVCLELKSKLVKIISSTFKKDLSQQLTSANIVALVKEVIKDKKDEKYILQVSDILVSEVRAKLVNQVDKIEVEPIGDAQRGFKLTLKDGSGYYDFSTNELMSMLKPYITKSVNKVLEEK